jgi:hypothetical protein
MLLINLAVRQCASAGVSALCLPLPCRDATPEEQEMEAEVEGLRKQLDELQTATPDETDTISDLKKELDEKERALYTLQVGGVQDTMCRYLLVFV